MITPGTTLGRYTVREPLGAGGMGEVYLAFDPELERTVALKVLPADLAGDAARVARFVREAKAASALNHPNILTVFDAGTHDDTRFLVTELVDGCTLREWSEHDRPSLAEILDVMTQAASALAAAHEAGIVHRDVKPENLMRRRDGLVKVLDFGIAKLTASPAAALDTGASTAAQPTHPGAVLGTVRYMSPEQASGSAVDARSDVWSLAVVLYELVAGRPPFAGASAISTLAAILERDPEPLERAAPNAPASLSRVVDHALRKRLDERIASAAHLATELRRVARELEHGTAPESEAMTATFAPVVAPPRETPPTNLPVGLSAIVGREREVEEVAGLLRAPGVRLVTLTGPGGTGKSRLALAVARTLLPVYRDGVFVVDLSPVSDPSLVAAHVGSALGLEEAGGAPMRELLARHLRAREVLLLLDGFEHVLEAAPLVADLLGASQKLNVLATSRAPLHLSHEREVAVEPLEVPAFVSLPPLEDLERAGAVALFVARAREAKPSFSLTSENAPAVVEICRRVDGLPLAIELAAARVKVFAPAALLGKLELKLLTGGARDLPGRQQTMRGALAWSFDLLDDGERELLCRLAVFAGGFDLDAAEAVCGAAELDVFDGIGSLVDKSLLRQPEQEDGEDRFRMLELVREYALEQAEASGWAASARGEHARYFLRVAEHAEPGLMGAEQAVWLERLGREHENLRAALAFLLDRSVDEGVRLAAALRNYWANRCYFTEGLRWAERALGTGVAAPTNRLQLLLNTAILRWRLGDLEGSVVRAHESLALAKELGHGRGSTVALNVLGNVAMDEARFSEARAWFEELRAVAESLEDRTMLAVALTSLGALASTEKDDAASVRFFEEALDAEGRDRCTAPVVNALTSLGGSYVALGEVAKARGCYREALAKARQLGNTFSCAMCLEGLAAVAVEKGRFERAAMLAGATEAHCESLGVSLPPAAADFRGCYLERLTASMEPAALERAWARGRAMGIEAATAEALESD